MAFGFFKKRSAPEQQPAEVAGAEQQKGFCEAGDQRPCVTVCTPTAGCSCDCKAVRQALEEEITARDLKISVGKMKAGCNGACPYGPLVGFPQKGFFYSRVTPQRAREVVAETLARGHIIFDLLHLDPLKSTTSRILYERRSGFIATIDDTFCMVQVARYFLEFDQGVSCGKCVPCRIGSMRLREILEGIIQGESQGEDLQLIELLCEAMREAPYCDFARVTSGPVASIFRYFRPEFEAHVEQHLCPAGVCPGLVGIEEPEPEPSEQQSD